MCLSNHSAAASITACNRAPSAAPSEARYSIPVPADPPQSLSLLCGYLFYSIRLLSTLQRYSSSGEPLFSELPEEFPESTAPLFVPTDGKNVMDPVAADLAFHYRDISGRKIFDPIPVMDHQRLYVRGRPSRSYQESRKCAQYPGCNVCLHVALRRLEPPTPGSTHAFDSIKYHSRSSRSHRSSSSWNSSPTSSAACSSASVHSSNTAPPQSSSPPSAGHPRLSVSSLLCEDPETTGISYRLEIVQQPERGAEFGTRYLSRLPVSPPPIVQLHIKDQAGNPVNEDFELPFLVVHLGIITEDGKPILNTSSSPSGSQSIRLLYGTIVSSPHYLRNLQGKKGVYFLFPDVSVQCRGRYRLTLSLIRLSSHDASGVVGVGGQGTVLTEVRTDPFEVVPYSSYIAPPQTQLSQYFVQQGARMFTFSSPLSNPGLQSPVA